MCVHACVHVHVCADVSNILTPSSVECGADSVCLQQIKKEVLQATVRLVHFYIEHLSLLRW